jgi:hypothetical protein
MANLKPTLHSFDVSQHGAKHNVAPGRIVVRSPRALTVETDGVETHVESNVDTEIATQSGRLAIVPQHAPVAVELHAYPAADFPAAAAGEAAPSIAAEVPAAPPTTEATPHE